MITQKELTSCIEHLQDVATSALDRDIVDRIRAVVAGTVLPYAGMAHDVQRLIMKSKQVNKFGK